MACKPRRRGVSHRGIHVGCRSLRGRRPRTVEGSVPVSTLMHEGWLEDPSVSCFNLLRYHRYDELLNSWATTAQTRPELIEMWADQALDIR